jgi:hypothetical protein
MRPGWDSYDASAVDSETRLKAATFLRMLHRNAPHISVPVIFASPSGGVMFRWESGEKQVEAEIASDSCRYFIETEAGTPRRRHGTLGAMDVDKLVALVLREIA